MTFVREEEAALGAAFMAKGYVVAPAEDRVALDRIRDFVAERSAAFLSLPVPADPGRFLDELGPMLTDATRQNDLRLALIDALRAAPWFREAYFACGRGLLESLVGNELAMQRGLGFSIQVPEDESAVLPLHSDVWSEDSPFEVVLWIPLVDVMRTKAMFALPLERDPAWRDRIAAFAGRSVEAFFAELEHEIEYIDVPYGNVLCFTHTIMHGNRINSEPTTRWSINVRFKGLFTPYSDKKLGDFFTPISLRPASQIGLRYRLPGGFDA